MIKPESVLCPRPEGLYCAPGDFFVDPVRPVDRAVITHGREEGLARWAELNGVAARPLALIGYEEEEGE